MVFLEMLLSIFCSFSFFFQSERGIFPQTEIVFDLELPKDFVPSNNDGEVDEFCLVPASQLVEKICDPQMKTTSCPVTLDFLIRKGILTHDTGIYIYITREMSASGRLSLALRVS